MVTQSYDVSRVRSVVGSNELDLAPRVVIGNQAVQSSHYFSESCSEPAPHLLLRAQRSLTTHNFGKYKLDPKKTNGQQKSRSWSSSKFSVADWMSCLFFAGVALIGRARVL